MPLAPLRVVRPDESRALPPASPLARWGGAVAGAEDGCVVLDRGGWIVSISLRAAALLGADRRQLLGKHLLEVVPFVDFDSGGSDPAYAPRVPPLLALSAGTLARGIVRVQTQTGRRTLDIVAAPLLGTDGLIAGSLSFLSPITPDGDAQQVPSG